MIPLWKGLSIEGLNKWNIFNHNLYLSHYYSHQFKLPLNSNKKTTVAQLKRVGTLPIKAESFLPLNVFAVKWPLLITAGDISSDGEKIILRSYNGNVKRYLCIRDDVKESVIDTYQTFLLQILIYRGKNMEKKRYWGKRGRCLDEKRRQCFRILSRISRRSNCIWTLWKKVLHHYGNQQKEFFTQICPYLLLPIKAWQIFKSKYVKDSLVLSIFILHYCTMPNCHVIKYYLILIHTWDH